MCSVILLRDGKEEGKARGAAGNVGVLVVWRSEGSELSAAMLRLVTGELR